SDAYNERPLRINDLYLDDIKLMTDDANGRYLLSSFYSAQKRGNIDGLYVAGIEAHTGNLVFEKTTAFDEDFKKRARERSGIKNAFDNFFINNIIVNADGSFTVLSEALYSTDNWDRWGYWGGGWGYGWGGPGFWGGWGPGWGWGWGRWGGGWWPYSYYSPFFYRS